MRHWIGIWGIVAAFSAASADDMFDTVIGSGHVAKESRLVTHVSAIKIDGIGDLVIRQGSAESLSVEADDNLFPYIQTVMEENGVLHISIPSNIQLHSMIPIRYGLLVKDLQAIEVAGEVTVEGVDSLRFSDIYLNIQGASVVTLDLRTKNLAVDMGGSSELHAQGTATAQELNLSGAAQYHAPDLVSDTVNIIADGATEAHLHVRHQLSATLDGASEVAYRGKPTIRSHIQGVAELHPME